MLATKQVSRLFILPLILLAFLPSAAIAGSITMLKQFSALNGTVNFLPGAWVITWENGKSSYYHFRDNQFTKMDNLPATLDGWQTYSWGDADYLDQIARSDYDPRINEFLPKVAKVKKVIESQIGSKKSDTFVLVCYTLKAADSDALPSSNDIYVTALSGNRNDSAPIYKALWTKKLQSDASYGEMSVQKIGSIDRFLVLYWGEVAGSGSVEGLNVYRISD